MARFRTLVLVVLALTHFSLGGLADASVLCIEPGGRISIERVGALCCEPRDACATEDDACGSESMALTSADCCPCIDIPLPEALARSAVGDAKAAKAALLLAIVPSTEVPWAPSVAVATRATLDPGRELPRPPPRTFDVLRC